METFLKLDKEIKEIRNSGKSVPIDKLISWGVHGLPFVFTFRNKRE